MLVFTISILPKTYFHNWIANHKDGSDCIQVHKTPVIHHQSINCHFDDLVVTASYVLQSEQYIPLPHIHISTHKVAFYVANSQVAFLHKESRGPPLMDCFDQQVAAS
jgi:hypothetical protein